MRCAVTAALIASATVIAATLAGCASDTRGTGDSPVAHPTDNTPAHIINMPDGFANVAWKCDGQGHRVYVTTRDAAPVILDDPKCQG